MAPPLPLRSCLREGRNVTLDRLTMRHCECSHDGKTKVPWTVAAAVDHTVATRDGLRVEGIYKEERDWTTISAGRTARSAT